MDSWLLAAPKLLIAVGGKIVLRVHLLLFAGIFIKYCHEGHFSRRFFPPTVYVSNTANRGICYLFILTANSSCEKLWLLKLLLRMFL